MTDHDEPTPADDTEEQQTPRSRRPRFLALSTMVVAAATVFAIVATSLWFAAAHSSALALATARDNAFAAARTDVATVNTLNYHNVRDGLNRWASVSTGTLRQQLTQVNDATIKQITAAKMVTSATVLSVAVSSVDLGKGTATAIASVNVRKQPASGSAVTTRNRFQLALQLADGTWKLSDVKIVAVQLT